MPQSNDGSLRDTTAEDSRYIPATWGSLTCTYRYAKEEYNILVLHHQHEYEKWQQRWCKKPIGTEKTDALIVTPVWITQLIASMIGETLVLSDQTVAQNDCTQVGGEGPLHPFVLCLSFCYSGIWSTYRVCPESKETSCDVAPTCTWLGNRWQGKVGEYNATSSAGSEQVKRVDMFESAPLFHHYITKTMEQMFQQHCMVKFCVKLRELSVWHDQDSTWQWCNVQIASVQMAQSLNRWQRCPRQATVWAHVNDGYWC